MKFHRHVTQEVRELLLEQLKEYEAMTPMNKEERKALHNWVANGRSPYDNGDYICGDGGFPLDFISALRAEKELQDWFDGLSEEEKETERHGCCYQYSPQTNEIYFGLPALQRPDEEECDLPFQ